MNIETENLDCEEVPDELDKVKARIADPIQNNEPASISIGMFAATYATQTGFEMLAAEIYEMLKEQGDPIFETDSNGEEIDTGRVALFSDAERQYLEAVQNWYERCASLAAEMNDGLSDIERGIIPVSPQ